MTTCKRVRHRLSAYIDNELPEAEQVEVSAHLSRCDACAQYRDDLMALGGLLNVPATVQAGDDFTAGVLARLRGRAHEPALSRLRRAVWRPMPGWAAAAVIAMAVALGSGLAWLSAPDATSPARVAAARGVVEELGLDTFRPLPEGSFGDAYVQVAWSQDGEGP